MDITIAWRNIWRNPRRTAIIITAVTIGILSMILLTSLMRGMVVDMVETGIATLTGDVRVCTTEFKDDPSVENRINDPAALLETIGSCLPENSRIVSRIRVNAIAQNARNSAGVVLAGIDPAAEKGVSFIGEGVYQGEMIKADDPDGIVLGKALVEKFETRLGRKLILMSEDANHEIASRAFIIRGIYRAKLESTEKRYVFVSRAAAGEMLKIGTNVSEISIMLQNHDQAPETAKKITSAIDTDRYRAEPWQQMEPMLKAYIEIFNGFILLWYLVVFTAMAFGIINTTLMAVFERMREFGLLKALGMRPARILCSVLTESFIILTIGTCIGNIAALPLAYALGRRGIDLSMFAAGFEYAGMSSVIYPAVSAADVLLANAVVIILGMAVSAYPASKAARITPVEAMARI
jgi:ABC-type lipoprotein release transport system permease subunit